MELAAAGPVDETTADDVDADDEEDKMNELVGEGMIDEVEIEESDVVVPVLAPVPQKRPRKQEAGAILSSRIMNV